MAKRASPSEAPEANRQARTETEAPAQTGGQTNAPAPAPTTSGARERILEAAKRLFAERGVPATSIADIARAAGVSKANVFHHFGSKQTLHLEIVRSLTFRGSELFERLGESDPEAPQRLARFVQEHLQAILSDPVGSQMMLGELLSTSPQHIRYLAEEVFQRDFQRLVDMIAGAQAEGIWRPGPDPAAVAFVLISANVFYFQAHPLIRHFRAVTFAQTPERYTDTLIDLLLHGLTPRPAPADNQASDE